MGVFTLLVMGIKYLKLSLPDTPHPQVSSGEFRSFSLVISISMCSRYTVSPTMFEFWILGLGLRFCSLPGVWSPSCVPPPLPQCYLLCSVSVLVPSPSCGRFSVHFVSWLYPVLLWRWVFCCFSFALCFTLLCDCEPHTKSLISPQSNRVLEWLLSLFSLFPYFDIEKRSCTKIWFLMFCICYLYLMFSFSVINGLYTMLSVAQNCFISFMRHMFHRLWVNESFKTV